MGAAQTTADQTIKLLLERHIKIAEEQLALTKAQAQTAGGPKGPPRALPAKALPFDIRL